MVLISSPVAAEQYKIVWLERHKQHLVEQCIHACSHLTNIDNSSYGCQHHRWKEDR
jgi:hypothetical protein